MARQTSVHAKNELSREGKESSAQPSSMVNKCDAVPEGRALSGKLQLQQARKGLHRACAVNGKPLAAPTLCTHGRVPDWLCICTRVQIAYEAQSPTKQHTTHRDLQKFYTQQMFTFFKKKGELSITIKVLISTLFQGFFNSSTLSRCKLTLSKQLNI